MAAQGTQRPSIIGPDSGPIEPFPLRLDGTIIKGFGRGSKELGIPTANIPVDGLEVAGRRDFESGIYFGWAGLHAPHSVHGCAGCNKSAAAINEDPHQHAKHCAETYAMVMSVGWNPFYKNEKRSVEIHIIHKFPEDFYDAHIRLLILGFVRAERDYDSLDALVADINTDIDVTNNSLARPEWTAFRKDPWLVALN